MRFLQIHEITSQPRANVRTTERRVWTTARRILCVRARKLSLGSPPQRAATPQRNVPTQVLAFAPTEAGDFSGGVRPRWKGSAGTGSVRVGAGSGGLGKPV